MNKQNTKVSSTHTVEPTMEAIIAMDAPSWHTKKIWEEYQSQFEKLRKQFSDQNTFKKLMVQELIVSLNKLEFQRNRGSLRTRLSSKILQEKFMSAYLFSTPDTGQDPKMENDKNLHEAAKHAARHWGSNPSGESDWITDVSLNVVMYPNGKVVFKPVNGEHRLWGIIGFQLGLIPLISPDGKDLFFYSKKLHGGAIKVNDLTSSEIVELANDNLVDRYKIVREQEVLDRFNGNTVPVELLPMYDNEQCTSYFREVNDSASDKKAPQMLHAFSDFSNLRIRTFGSIKNHRFFGSDDKLNPFAQDCFTTSQNVKLIPFMHIHMITQFEIKKGFVKSTDDALFENYLQLNGYRDHYDAKFVLERRVVEDLYFLHSVFKFYPEKNPSKQNVQQVLMIRKHLIENGLRILDTKLFMQKFYEFVKTNSNEINKKTGRLDKKARTAFGTDMANSSLTNYESAWKFIRKNFIGNGKNYLSMKSEDDLFQIGIVPIGLDLPRFFSKDRVDISVLENKGLDIDGVSLEEKRSVPVGGHIISDWELKQLSDYERDIAAKREGCFLNDEFEFTQNCRAMSKYHNDRMGVLPLSIYMEVINESDEVVRAREKQFREEVVSRLSKYHKAA